VKLDIARWEPLIFGAAVLLAVFTYLYGLGDVGIPSNGDEGVYIHIARKTSEGGHWLPLATDIERVRNTKPPLLFWQGIATTDHGSQWTLWRLRLPSALYTLATAALLFSLVWHLRRQWRSASLAALIYLGFYSTYRYGRPFLTNAPETFWLTVPGIAVLWTRGGLLESRLLVPFLFGIAAGIACLYKSFALVVPFSLTLTGWYFERHGYRIRESLARAVPAVFVAAATALAIFALWPLLDPDPGAIWRDFILRENAGKFDSAAGLGNYLKSFIWGSWSVWSLFVALLADGGLLAPILLALIINAWRRRRSLETEERLLWIWVIAFFVAFSIPSQRSGRYLLPAMPALAALTAMAWPRLHRAGAITVAAVATVLGAVLAIFSALVVRQTGGDLMLPFEFWLVISCVLALGGASLVVPRLARSTAPVFAILVSLAMGMSLNAYSKPPGPYTAATRDRMRGETVFVPCDFLASEEATRFLLPGADVRSYWEEDGLTLETLATRYRFFAAFVPLGVPPQCDGCRVLDARYAVRGRHTSIAVGDAPAARLVRDFFEREVLFESTRGPADPPPFFEACAR
jgi:4-amino-4-deoxy-L-arabinose transferase-like glycosyltransferase